MATKFVPSPANSGGRQRSLALATRLAARSDLTLCAFDDGDCDIPGLEALGIDVRPVPWPPGRANMLRGLLRARSVSAARFFARAMQRTVDAAVADGADRLVVSYSALSYLLDTDTTAVTALDLHNVESSLLQSYQRSREGLTALALRPEVLAMTALERRAVRRADVVSVVSDVDRDRVRALGRPDALLCPNGWQPHHTLPPATGPVAIFVGLLGWRPNVEAAEWLVHDVWPEVRRKVEGARLLLVGRDPTAAVRELAGPDVDVTGTVPEIEPYLARARVALAPLRAGGGSRLKILEALGAGRPVVATRIGAEGLTDLEGEGLVIADDAGAYAAAVIELLASPEPAASLGSRGREAVASRYGWDQTLAPLLEAVT